jgi:hypothetical protein
MARADTMGKRVKMARPDPSAPLPSQPYELMTAVMRASRAGTTCCRDSERGVRVKEPREWQDLQYLIPDVLEILVYPAFLQTDNVVG